MSPQSNKSAILELNPNVESLNRVEEQYKPFVSRRVSISSEFVKKDGQVTQDIIRGLSEIEEHFLMPRTIIKCKNTDDKFTQECYDYWADYEIKLKDNTKRILDISITSTVEATYNGKKVTYNVPNNLHDYIAYNFALRSSNVAYTKIDKERGSRYDFILSEPEETKKEKTFSIQTKQNADANYLQLTNGAVEAKYDPSIDYVFQLLKENTFVEIGDFQDKLNWLYEYKEKNPAKFVGTMGIKNLKEQAEILKLVEIGILTKVDNYYSYDAQSFGTMETTIKFFADATNSVTVNHIRSLATQRNKQETVTA